MLDMLVLLLEMLPEPTDDDGRDDGDEHEHEHDDGHGDGIECDEYDDYCTMKMLVIIIVTDFEIAVLIYKMEIQLALISWLIHYTRQLNRKSVICNSFSQNTD